MNAVPRHFKDLDHLGDASPLVASLKEIIEHIHLFEDFDADEIARLACYMQTYRAPAGTEIIREGEPGDFMLLIIEGSVEIIRKDSRGLPARIGVAGPGKTLGEMSMIDGEPRFASCVAISDAVTFAVLDRESLSRIITDEPRMGVKILMELLMLLNQRLRTTSAQLVQCLEQKARRIGI